MAVLHYKAKYEGCQFVPATEYTGVCPVAVFAVEIVYVPTVVPMS